MAGGDGRTEGRRNSVNRDTTTGDRQVLEAKMERVETVDVILPVLDEAGNLPWVLGRFPEGFRPLVVDNGSRDGSAGIARSCGVEVVEEQRKGFGSACWTGLNASSSRVVCFMDADGSLDPADLDRVAGPVRDSDANLCLGRRAGLPGAMSLHARVGNAVIAQRLRRKTGTSLHDLGPMRAARRAGLLDLGLEDRRFGWPLEMVIKAAEAGWVIQEVDVPYANRRSGSSKVTGTFMGTARTVRDMWRFLT